MYEETYEIVRFYADSRESRVIAEGLTIDEAQEHCKDPETSSTTCSEPSEGGQWFDGYREA